MGTGLVQAMDVRPTGKLGFDFGGDTLVTAVFTSGETESIKSNEGLYLGGGVSILSDSKQVETEVTLSYKFSFIDAQNGSIDWTRWPLDALVFYRAANVRVGGGVTYHLNPKLDGSGVVGGLNVTFKDSLGFVLGLDWRLGENGYLGIRYTAIDYDVESGGFGTVASRGVGLALGARF
jgi:hypothetical protein